MFAILSFSLLPISIAYHMGGIRLEARPTNRISALAISLSRIVAGIQIFEAQRTDARYLGDVLTGLCPVEVGRIAGQNDHATGRICLHLFAVELIAETDVENTKNNGVNSVLRVSVWHELHAGGHFDPDRVGAGLRGLTDNDRETDRR